MGTMGTVRVFDGDVEILCFTRHSDGYPAGLGAELQGFCASKKIVNGISERYDTKKIANGTGCLAGQLILHFKGGVGGIYIHAPGGSRSKSGFEYRVKCPDYKAIDKADRAADKFGADPFLGLPIVVEGFDCYRGKALPAPNKELPSEDEDEEC